jgi:hypothetical protein
MNDGIFYLMTVHERFSHLRSLLEDQVKHSQRMATLYYVASFSLMVCALASTIAASAAGIFHLVHTPETVGWIAGLPAVFGLAAITLKLDERWQWEYRKAVRTRNILRRLLHRGPDPMTIEYVSSIDEEFSAMDLAMAEERRTQIFDWATVMRYKTPEVDQPDEKKT